MPGWGSTTTLYHRKVNVTIFTGIRHLYQRYARPGSHPLDRTTNSVGQLLPIAPIFSLVLHVTFSLSIPDHQSTIYLCSLPTSISASTRASICTNVSSVQCMNSTRNACSRRGRS
ncbi:hypothetical protein RSOL_334370 [Rhizoctonia solani AG-3 Rhs1AP]|uniref:Uncharacterized protein n=2 Tax=Rhizoctonia solani AG-3 TaxID=1086053 RepID=A0A074RCX0_9AGAM|nr:hypothetical protein RSOL_334370 [Rhizoctonia solani AG-3 Rhs1AP]KEP45016.1 hypothetical protein V565_329960 [Rhizoctonia solani 123E]